MRIFLGGTCADSRWREELIPMLKAEYYNPVVPEWTEEAYQRELREREVCDICLYVITPKLEGFYSIAEVADDSNKRPERTVLCVLSHDEDFRFSDREMRSLRKVGTLISNNGGYFFEGMEALVQYLNSRHLLARSNSSQ